MVTKEKLLFQRPYQAPESELLEIRQEDCILYGNITPAGEVDWGEDEG